jgi:hypothetical protein
LLLETCMLCIKQFGMMWCRTVEIVSRKGLLDGERAITFTTASGAVICIGRLWDSTLRRRTDHYYDAGVSTCYIPRYKRQPIYLFSNATLLFLVATTLH